MGNVLNVKQYREVKLEASDCRKGNPDVCLEYTSVYTRVNRRKRCKQGGCVK